MGAEVRNIAGCLRGLCRLLEKFAPILSTSKIGCFENRASRNVNALDIRCQRAEPRIKNIGLYN